jgi:hypothetical protein
MLGFTSVGPRFAVSFLDGPPATLALVENDGTVSHQVSTGGTFEGLIHDAANGRILGVDYEGFLETFDATTLAISGDTAHYPDEIGVSGPSSLAWNPDSSQFIALTITSEARLTAVGEDGNSGTVLPANFAGIRFPSTVEYADGPDEILVLDRLPPEDPNLGPQITRYGAGGGEPIGTIALQGVPRPFRAFGLGYIGSLGQVVTTIRIPGNPNANAQFYRHDLAGNQHWFADLRWTGFVTLGSASWLANSDELLFLGSDVNGIPRYLVTDLNGNPRRSYRADGVAGEAAPIVKPGDPSDGKIGVVLAQPSQLVRIALP